MFRFNNPDALLVLLLVGAAVRDDPRARRRPHALARARRRARRLRLPHQDAAGVPRAARRSRSCTCSPARRRSGARDLAARARRGVAMLVAVGLVGRDRRALARVEPPVHRRLAEQQHSEPDLRLQRLRPPHRQRERAASAAAPAGTAGRWGPTGWTRLCQSAVRRPGLVADPRRADPARRRARAHRCAGRAPTARAPRSCSGAAGCSSRRRRSASPTGIIHPYYTVALAPAIGALVGIGAVTLWHNRASWFSRSFARRRARDDERRRRTACSCAAPTWHPSLRTLVLVRRPDRGGRHRVRAARVEGRRARARGRRASSSRSPVRSRTRSTPRRRRTPARSRRPVRRSPAAGSDSEAGGPFNPGGFGGAPPGGAAGNLPGLGAAAQPRRRPRLPRGPPVGCRSGSSRRDNAAGVDSDDA